MKQKIYTVCLILTLFVFILPIYSQVTQQWAQRYTGNFVAAEGRSIALDNLGNIYVSGRGYDTLSEYNYVTIKYNSSGVIQWAKTYNGTGNDDDFAYYIAADASGNVYVSGYSKGDGTGWDFCTIKYNTDGVQQWLQRYNGTGNGEDHVSAMGIDNSGNVYVTGWSYGPIPGFSTSGMSITTIKYSTIGTQQWIKKYNAPSNTLNPGYDYAYALNIDNSGNVYVAGKIMGMGGYPYSFMQYCVTIKYNSFGDTLWSAKYCSPDSLSLAQISPIAIAVSTSGNVFVTGACSFVNANGIDYITLKYNTSGIYQWAKTYNGSSTTGNNKDQPTSIAVDVNNVYVTGVSTGSTTGYDYATVKYDFSGVQQWVQRYSFSANSYDVANSIVLDAAGNSFVTGLSFRNGSSGPSDFATIKYDYFGNQKWVLRYTGNLNEGCSGNSIAISSTGSNMIINSIVVTGSANNALTTVKYLDQVGIRNISSEIPYEFLLHQNYPNPFNPNTAIRYQLSVSGFTRLKVFDLTGKEVATLVNENQSAGIYEADFNGENLSSGIYYYRIETGNFVDTKKMILIK